MTNIFINFFNKEAIENELGNFAVEKSERERLLDLVNEIVEYRMLGAVLEQLEEKDKNLFLEQMHSGSDIMVTQILRDKIANLEEVLKAQAAIIETEIIEDIKNLK